MGVPVLKMPPKLIKFANSVSWIAPIKIWTVKGFLD